LFFVGGFTVMFVIFGLLINASIRLIAVGSYSVQTTIYRVGGVLIILFGLQVMGLTGWVLRFLTTRVDWQQMGTSGERIQHTLENILAVLYGDTRRQMNPRNGFGYAGSALMGVIFAAGWSPCLGPIIGSILTIAGTVFTGNTLGKASSLLFAYSLGLGVPFLLASVALDRMRGLMKRIQRRSRVIELVSGGMLIVIGVLFVTNQFAYLNAMAGGLATVSYNLEACSTGILRGEFPAGDWGTCMKLGPNYQELMPKSQAEPSVLAVLDDGRMLVIGG
jgi:cytochrome c-type biogenesis protein